MATAVPAATGFVPGNSSADSLVAEILAIFADIDDPNLQARALLGIHSGISRINSRTWKKLFGSTDITLVASTSEYVVPDTFKDPVRCLLLDSSDNRQGRLPYLSDNEFYEVMSDVSASGGSPSVYTFDYSTRKIVLDIAPDASWLTRYATARLKFHKRFAKFSGSATSGLPPEFDEYLVAQGAAWYGRSRNPDRLPELRSDAGGRWRDLVSDDNNILTDYQ